MGYKKHTKEGITMIYLPESVERTLARIEEAYKRDIKKRRSYYSSIIKDGKTYTGTDTVKIMLEDFKKFKASSKKSRMLKEQSIQKMTYLTVGYFYLM